MSFSGSVYEISTDAEKARDGSVRVVLYFRNVEHHLSVKNAMVMYTLLGLALGKAELLSKQGGSAAASPPNGARDHSEARLDESKDETLCIKCGKRKRYEHKGRVFALCAVCGWNNIQEFLDLPDTAAELRNEADRSGDENSNMELCGNCGVPRFIHGGVLEKCPNCGDDEWDLALRSEYP